MSLSTNTTYRVLVEKLGSSDPNQFIGNEGEVFYDPSIPALKLSDGSTTGGLTIGGGGGGGESYWVSTEAGIHTTSNVGIGTTNPQTKLQINGVLGFGTFTGGYATRTNIRIGDNTTGASITDGYDNIFMGIGAGNSTTSGCFNNFFGFNAGRSNTTGGHNNFFGNYAGNSNTTGGYNNFFGNYAGYNNTTGGHNNFFGSYTGNSNTTGGYNNFFGRFAGNYNTEGSENNFFGSSAGRKNTTGISNNFLGGGAGSCNTTGNHNNFLGSGAGEYNTTGEYNNFFGRRAGRYNTTGGFNNFFGLFAGICNTTGIHNTFLGAFSGISTSASNKIILGRGGAYNQLFDAPDTTKDTQFAVGIRTDANPANYWLVGNENFNVGIGTTNPTSKLTVQGGDVKVGVNTSHGLIITSPNGTQYRLIVDNSGVLSTASI